jgi:hypothetical protein
MKKHDKSAGLAKAHAAPREVNINPSFLLTAAAASLLAVLLFMRPPVVLPVIAVVFIVGASLMALIAWSLGVQYKSDGVMPWGCIRRVGAYGLRGRNMQRCRTGRRSIRFGGSRLPTSSHQLRLAAEGKPCSRRTLQRL